jgi:hypothetical protein
LHERDLRSPRDRRVSLVKPIKTDLLSPEKIEDLRSRVARKVSSASKPTDYQPRMNELQLQINNLADAIASGALKTPPSIGARLAAAEAELDRLSA